MKRCAKQLRIYFFVPLRGQWAECACAVRAWCCAAVGKDKGKAELQLLPHMQHKEAIAQTRYDQDFQNLYWWGNTSHLNSPFAVRTLTHIN